MNIISLKKLTTLSVLGSFSNIYNIDTVIDEYLDENKHQINSVLFVCFGDTRFGSADFNESALNNLNERLSQVGCQLGFMRGSNDDPKFFNETPIKLSNIFTIPDYSIIEMKTHNVCIIGGGISFDRRWKQQMIDSIKSIPINNNNTIIEWYSNENFIYDDKQIEELESDPHKIDVLLTYNGILASNDKKLEYWCSEDDELVKEIKEERCKIVSVYQKLCNKQKSEIVWVYGNTDNFKQHKKTINITYNTRPLNIFKVISNG